MSKVNARIVHHRISTDNDFTPAPNSDFEEFNGWTALDLADGEIGVNLFREKIYANINGVVKQITTGEGTVTIDTTPITGGATGYPLYHKSGNVVGEFTGAYFDTVNNRVGIRTTTPAGTLHVKGVGNLVTDVIARFEAPSGDGFSFLGDGSMRGLLAYVYQQELGMYRTVNNYVKLYREEDRIKGVKMALDGESNVAQILHYYRVGGLGSNLLGDALNIFNRNSDGVFGSNINFISVRKNTGDSGFNFFAPTTHTTIDTTDGTDLRTQLDYTGAWFYYNALTTPTPRTDSFTHYAKDIVAGNSSPHWKTENGNEIRLYKQSTPTTLSDVITLLTNLGLC